MVKALIITADDFGLGPGVNRAVAEAHRAGVLTSASLMATAPGFDEAVALACDLPSLEIGLHFVLAWGRPLSSTADVPSLVGRNGAFLSRRSLLLRAVAGRLQRYEIARELEGQLERLRRAKISPSFINGDQHVHILPVVRDVVLDTAARYGLAVRVPQERRLWHAQGTPLLQWRHAGGRLATKVAVDMLGNGFAKRCRAMGLPANAHFLSPFGIFPSPRFSLDAFGAVLKRLQDGLTELMVHPAYLDEASARFWVGGEAQARDRELELASLLAPGFAALLKEAGASLTTFARALGTPRPLEV